MNLKTAIFEHLKNDPAVSGIVAERIYRNFAPEGAALPFVTYRRITAANQNDIDLSTERYQFDLVGKLTEDDQLEELKEALIDSLNRFKGDLGGTGFQVTSVWLEIMTDDSNVETDARRVVIDFKFAYFRT